MKRLIICTVLALAACSPEKPATQDAATPAAVVAAAQPAGPAVVVKPRDEEGGHHRDTNVARVLGLKAGDAKFFSVVGGDPAINGEYLYLAIAPDTPVEDFKVYMIGDFNSWELESESEGSAVVKVSRSTIDEAGEIKTAEERYIVAVPAWSATETTVTPAK